MSTVGYQVVAANPSRHSENRIHSDEVARRHGFRGGLVPGVTVYRYLVPGLLSSLGPAWVETGVAEVRFRSPCYEGDRLDVSISDAGGLDGGVGFEVRSGDTVCVTGSAAASPRGGAGSSANFGWVDAEAHVVALAVAEPPAPADRPLASAASLAAGTVLGSVDLDTSDATLEDVGNRWAHPGVLLEGANRLLTANVVLPLWLHVGSEIRHLRAVTAGEPLTVGGRVAREWEHAGHRFVNLDVAWMTGIDCVATGGHTAIWRLAGS